MKDPVRAVTAPNYKIEVKGELSNDVDKMPTCERLGLYESGTQRIKEYLESAGGYVLKKPSQ